jgi:hypothetical protein
MNKEYWIFSTSQFSRTARFILLRCRLREMESRVKREIYSSYITRTRHFTVLTPVIIRVILQKFSALYDKSPPPLTPSTPTALTAAAAVASTSCPQLKIRNDIEIKISLSYTVLRC